MKKLNDIHDKFFRKLVSNPKMARELCELYLSAELLKLLDLDSLELQDTSLLDAYLRQLRCDVLYKVKFKDRLGYAYLLFEHQSRPEKKMPLRIALYKFRMMDKERSHILPIVIPIVFYHGKKPYTYSTDLFDLFGEAADLAKTHLLSPFTLIDLNKISDTEIKQHKLAMILEFMQKHIYDDNLLIRLIEIVPQLNELSQMGADECIITALEYAIHAGAIDSPEQLNEFVINHLSPNLRSETMTVAQQLEARGETRGKAESTRQIAINLLHEDFDLKIIARVTGLEIEDLKKLAQEVVAI
jgi:predicted transposase/invertase (TIGR01784 family)